MTSLQEDSEKWRAMGFENILIHVLAIFIRGLNVEKLNNHSKESVVHETLEINQGQWYENVSSIVMERNFTWLKDNIVWAKTWKKRYLKDFGKFEVAIKTCCSNYMCFLENTKNGPQGGNHCL